MYDIVSVLEVGDWRNGKRKALKTPQPQGFTSSTLVSPTILLANSSVQNIQSPPNKTPCNNRGFYFNINNKVGDIQ